jgi:hypothetical protein
MFTLGEIQQTGIPIETKEMVAIKSIFPQMIVALVGFYTVYQLARQSERA